VTARVPEASRIPVVLNGEETLVALGSTLEDLVELAGVDPKGIAIALDGEVVPRSRWSGFTVPPGAHVEIVTAAAGG
jgi:sulfur carrier protein